MDLNNPAEAAASVPLCFPTWDREDNMCQGGVQTA